MKNLKSIAVLFGGPSSEAEVSAVSAQAVCEALERQNLAFTKINISNADWMTQLATMAPDFAFLAVHGCPGEDGTVQGVLDLMGIPYNGSGVLASALAMDKPRAKILFTQEGIDVAAEYVLPSAMDPDDVAEILKDFVPCVLKPASGGSSVGVRIMDDINHIAQDYEAVAQAAGKGDVVAEAFIPGQEFTVTVMGDTALEVTEIIPSEKHVFYDYESKYEPGGSVHQCPAQIDDRLRQRLLLDAEKAAEALGCNGVVRVDFRYDAQTDWLVALEINTLPGLTPTSLTPEQAKEHGISFDELVLWMIEEGLFRKQ